MAYRNVQIPRELADEIDRLVDTGHLGFKSRADFVKHASRLELRRAAQEIAVA